MKLSDQYNAFADQYHAKRRDQVRSLWNTYLDIPTVRSMLDDDLQGKQIADLGCGSGIFSGLIASLGAEVIGIDISEKLIEIAKRENPGIFFQVGDVTKTDLPAQRCDYVVSCLVMHYFDDLIPFFSEVARILRPSSGRFVFSFHHPVNEVLRREAGVVGLNPYFHNERYTWKMLDGMELESFHHTFEDISGALFKTGFVIEEIKEARPPSHLSEVYPEWFQFVSRYPTFAAIRAVLR